MDFYPKQDPKVIQRGVTEGNTFTKSGRVVNQMDTLVDGTTPFGETIVVNKHPVLNVQSHHGITDQRDYIIENGVYETGSLFGGTQYVDHDGRWNVVGVSGSSETIEFQTAQTGVYISGYWAEMGIGLKTATPEQMPANVRVYAGYCDSQNGFGWMIHESGYYIFLRHSGTETLIGQNPNQPLTTLASEDDIGWNVDRANGDGGRENASGFNLNIDRGYMLQGRFLHYGMGNVTFYISRTNGYGYSEKLRVHEFEREGEPVLDNPNLPVTCEVVSNASYTGGEFKAYVGGRQMSVLGSYVPSFRFSHETKPALEITDGNWHPLVSALPNQQKDGIQTFADRITLSTDANIQWGLFLNPIFATTPNWQYPRANLDDSPDGNSTAVKYSREDIAITGGVRLDGDILSATSQGQNRINFQLDSGLFLPIPRNRPITLAVKRINNVTVNVFGSLTLREEF